MEVVEVAFVADQVTARERACELTQQETRLADRVAYGTMRFFLLLLMLLAVCRRQRLIIICILDPQKLGVFETNNSLKCGINFAFDKLIKTTQKLNLPDS